MKKFLAMLLCVCLVVSMMPAVFAAEAETAHVHTEEQSALLQQLLADTANYVAYYGLSADMPDSVLMETLYALDDPYTAYVELEIIGQKSNSLSGADWDAFYSDRNTQLCERFYEVIQSAFSVSLLSFDADGYSYVNGVGVFVEGGTSYDETEGTVTVTATSSSKKDSCGNVTYTPVTATVTLYNDAEFDGMLSFTYTLTNCNSLTINGNAVTASGTFSEVIAAGDCVEIVLKSGENTTENRLVLSNLSVKEMADSSDITVKYDSAYGSVTMDGTVVNADDVLAIEQSVTLVAAAKSGAQFVAWMNEGGKILSKNASLNVDSTGAQTVRAVFEAANGTAWFEANNGYMYNDLAVAATKGNRIVLMNSGVVAAGTYTIPAGVTLLIPFDAAGTLYLEEPESITAVIKPSAYRTMTLASGANLVVNGTISLSAKMSATQRSNGSVSGPYGHMKMEEGSKITVNNGGVLYAWGFITGAGTVEVLSGGMVHENFHVRDWRGGTALLSILAKSSNDAFIFSQYYVQNIQTAMTIYAGAKENGFMAITVSGTMHDSGVDFIGGQGAMFNLSSGYVVKDLVEETGRTAINVYGNVSIDPISVTANITNNILESTIDSDDYILPINGNMDVSLLSGNATINQSLVLLPGANMYIAEGTKCTLGSGKVVFLYDADDWTTESVFFEESNKPVTDALHPYYVPAGSETVAGRDQDASVCVDGFIDASAGYVYTTTHGANVYSNGGGQIKMKTNYLKSDGSYNHKLAYIKQVSTNVSYDTIAITTAQLQNADGSTVKFDKSSGTINYVDGVWTCAHEYAPYTVAPTCTEQGYTIYTCACGASIKENYVDALGHDPVQHAGQDATCTEAGWAAYETCSRCDYTTYAEIAASGHSYDDGVITTAPGCESEGVKTYTCSDCGHSYTEALSATGHSYKAVVTAPTCTADGYTTYTCSGCGHSYTDDVVAATGHSHKAEVTAPDCENGGYTTYTCACGDSYTADETAALGHSYDDGVITTNPGCEAEGVKTYTCSACGDSYTEAVGATGHSYNAEVTDPTCTADGYTTYTCACGHSYTDNTVTALGHSYDDGVVTTDPSCESDGVKTYTCSACGDSYTEAISATGHSYNAEVTDPTCTADGYTTYTCACGHSYTDNTVTALGHSYDGGIVTTDPSCVAEGVKTYTCHCGDSYNEPVAALGHDMQVQPGQAPTVDVNGWTEHTACSRCDHKEGYEDLYYYNGLFVANGASYLNWEDALATGDTTIELLNNVCTNDFEIPYGITLDLNGMVLDAEHVVSFGDIIDTVGSGAVATQNLLTTNNSYLPLKDSSVYRFFAYELVSLGAKGNNAKVKFGFALNFADIGAYQLLAGDSGVDVTMTLTWNEGSAEFAFGADLVKAYAQLHLANPGRQAAMILNVTGADTLASGSELSLIPAVLALDGQISVVSDIIIYTVA